VLSEAGWCILGVEGRTGGETAVPKCGHGNARAVAVAAGVFHTGRHGLGHTIAAQGRETADQGRETAVRGRGIAIEPAAVTGVEAVHRGTGLAVHRLAVSGRGQGLNHIQGHQGERLNASDVQLNVALLQMCINSLGRLLRVDLIKWVSNVRPFTERSFDFSEIWYVGRGR